MKTPVIVLDAANPVGRGVVETALMWSRPVIAVTADAKALSDLRALQNAVTAKQTDFMIVDGSVADEACADQLVAALSALGRPFAGVVLTHCFASVRGRVADMTTLELRRVIEAEVLPQHLAAHYLLPLLTRPGRNGSFVVVGAAGTDYPWVGYGARSIAAAAAAMMVRVLHNEARLSGVRVQLLAVSRPVQTEDNQDQACARWPRASEIARQALALIDQVETQHPVGAVVRFEEAM